MNQKVPAAASRLRKWSSLVHTRRYDLVLVALSSIIGLFSGITLALAVLELLPVELVPLLGVLVLIGVAAVILIFRQRTGLEHLADAERADQVVVERASAMLAQDENNRLLASQRALIQALQTQLTELEHKISTPETPMILGWQNLGTDESEIALRVSLLTELFQGQHQVQITKKFDGGYRNRGVYLVRSSAEAERIVKLARSADIRTERRAQELINRFSQNNGAQLVRQVQRDDDSAPGGSVYRLASLRRNGDVLNFEAFYRERQDGAECAAIVEQLFADVLPHSQFRKVDSAMLFQEYAPTERVLTRAWNALENIPMLREVTRETEWAMITVGSIERRVRNPLYWASRRMLQYRDASLPIIRGVIHGDLHSGNLLIQLPGPNLWIIDFAKTRAEAHTLLDYARFEADLKFYLLSDSEPNYLEQTLRLEEQLLAPTRKQELDTLLEELEGYGAEFQKAGAGIAVLRRVAAGHRRATNDNIIGHFADETVLPYYLALFHCTVRMLTYDQCTAAQKTYAFCAAGLAAERITQLVT